jgi:hypothetical protein
MTPTAALIYRRPRVTHVPHDWTGGLLWVLCAVLALALIDANDNANEMRMLADTARAELAKERAIASLPDPAIIISARTAELYGLSLAKVAGGADAERMKMKGRK